MPGRPIAVHDVDLDVGDVDELAVERDVLHRDQPAKHLDVLAHRPQRPLAPDADLRRERVPPGADPQQDPSGRQVVEGDERRRHEADVSRPAVHDPRTDPDLRGGRGERGHRNRRLPDETALGLPHGLEPELLGPTDVSDPVPDGVLVLQVERDAAFCPAHRSAPPAGSNGCSSMTSIRPHSSWAAAWL